MNLSDFQHQVKALRVPDTEAARTRAYARARANAELFLSLLPPDQRTAACRFLADYFQI